ncbi:MAG: 16S rRNA (cytosine(1402)-N(4))-methyltransferase RsmH [Planctomycetes bacterium]|nr:16S rRNA (cytosine(1402)-N(4))-methyltransferase RsmH [Planctomycetota bacterium]
MHEPVLLAEVVAGLSVRPGARVLDGTVGTGGHASALLDANAPDGVLLGIDRDPLALAVARERLAPYGGRVRLRHARISEAPDALDAEGIRSVEAALLDLGASSLQFDTAERGFSFSADGPLDMRMDPGEEGETAADLVNRLPERALSDLIFRFGEDRRARALARAIVGARRRGPILRTLELARVLASVRGGGRSRLHPATRAFQALRIAVNREIEELRSGLPAVASRLAPGGRFGVIAFHSLEDREVKRFFRAGTAEGRFRLVTKRPIRPTPGEIDRNRRSRSARLRLVEVVAA